MTSKQNILDQIRRNLRQKDQMPDFSALSPVQYEDPLAKFMEMVQVVGGHVACLGPDENLNDKIQYHQMAYLALQYQTLHNQDFVPSSFYLKKVLLT